MELFDCGVEVSHQADVCEFEDGSISVFIDRDDQLGIFDSGHVLGAAADTGGDVEVWGDNFSGLPHLQLVGGNAAVYGGACGSGSSSEGVG